MRSFPMWIKLRKKKKHSKIKLEKSKIRRQFGQIIGENKSSNLLIIIGQLADWSGLVEK